VASRAILLPIRPARRRIIPQALRLNPNDQKVIRRLAVSYGISGQLDMADKTIQPLLYKSDRAAWRDKAFILAMNGKTSEAISISNQVMPGQLATAIKPYLERMAMLNAAQRAAAVHLGRFPPGLVNVQVASNTASSSAQTRAPAGQPAAANASSCAGTAQACGSGAKAATRPGSGTGSAQALAVRCHTVCANRFECACGSFGSGAASAG
jgi:hypothetical protein